MPFKFAKIGAQFGDKGLSPNQGFSDEEVVPGQIRPAFLSAKTQIFTPKVSRNIKVAFVVATSVVFAPIVANANTVAPAMLAANELVYTPSVSQGDLIVSPALVAENSQIFSPVATKGAVSIAPNFLASGNQILDPSILPGSVSVSPSLIADNTQIPNPSVNRGSVSVAPNLISSALQLPAPNILRGGVSVAPALLAAGGALYNPTVSIAASFQGFNPLDKDSAVTLSESNFRMTTSANDKGVRSVTSHTFGKRYFEIEAVVGPGGGGPATSTMNLGTWAGNTFQSLGFDVSTGDLYNNGSAPYNAGVSGSFPPAIAGYAVDLDAKKLWLSVDGVFGAGQDPEAGTGGFDFSVAGWTDPVHVFVSGGEPGSSYRFRSGLSQFSYTLPSFAAWG